VTGGGPDGVGPEGDGRHHVVIIGCGFGGLFAAKALKREAVRVTLIDRTNHHLFQPLLYQVATGILSEGQIAPAIRDVLRNHRALNVVLADVVRIDTEARVVHAEEFGEALAVGYDSLIVAGGSTTAYFGHDEFRAWASGMKSLDDALALRGQIFGAFERAEAEADETARQALMTFVVIGGGPTGVEMAGQLIELSRRALRRNYRRIDPGQARVVLVEGGDRLVATMGERLSRITARDLARLGVEIHFDAMVTGMDRQGVVITKHDGSTVRIDTDTRIWAAGIRASGLGGLLSDAAGVELDKSGRVAVEPDCSLPGHPEVFVVGDLMALGDLPGVAEVAMQSGAHAAHTIVRRLEGRPSKPFHYRDLGTLAVISRFRAVAEIGPIRVGGFVGWMLWLVVHITFLTGFKNRFGALARWAVSFIGRGRYERALTGRWVARADRTDRSGGSA
jgi:NADH:ubiquinone reductase (H+-translocating)